MRRDILSDDEFQRISNEYAKVKFECKNCKHKVVIPVWVDKQICSWCGNYVYRNKKMELEDNLKKAGVKILKK